MLYVEQNLHLRLPKIKIKIGNFIFSNTSVILSQYQEFFMKKFYAENDGRDVFLKKIAFIFEKLKFPIFDE
jgi:hypothetical protein